MSFPGRRVTTAATAGDIDTLVAGSVTAGASLALNQVEPGCLAAEVAVEAETNGITFSFKWQVSVDNSTWIDCANGPQNAAAVALATGTAGDDAAVTRVLEAPMCVFAFPYVRGALTNGAQTGAATDTYSIKYHYLKPRLFA